MYIYPNMVFAQMFYLLLSFHHETFANQVLYLAMFKIKLMKVFVFDILKGQKLQSLFSNPFANTPTYRLNAAWVLG